MALHKFMYPIAVIIVALITFSVPWYTEQDPSILWFGVPQWVAIAIIISFMVSIVIAFALCLEWVDEEHKD